MTRKSVNRCARRHPGMQGGIVLLEVLIALALFAVGVLGLVGLQAKSISMMRDSNYRLQATMITDQLIGAMWANRGNIGSYALNTPANSCTIANQCQCTPGTNSISGSTGAAGDVNNWLTQLTNELPGTAAYQQQIIVGNNNVVTVVVCWKAPQDSHPHNMTETIQIAG